MKSTVGFLLGHKSISREILIQRDSSKRDGSLSVKKAPDEVRELYNGKIIERKRSYGDPFIRVGYD